MRGGCCLT